MSQPMNYDIAFAELHQILQQLQNEETGLEQLSSQLMRAGELVKFCRERLRNIENELEKLNQLGSDETV